MILLLVTNQFPSHCNFKWQVGKGSPLIPVIGQTVFFYLY